MDDVKVPYRADVQIDTYTGYTDEEVKEGRAGEPTTTFTSQWFDTGGKPVTDPDRIAELESRLVEHGTD